MNLSGKKNSCLTQLWRVLDYRATKEENLLIGKLSGARTETFFSITGVFCPFFAWILSTVLKHRYEILIKKGDKYDRIKPNTAF